MCKNAVIPNSGEFCDVKPQQLGILGTNEST